MEFFFLTNGALPTIASILVLIVDTFKNAAKRSRIVRNPCSLRVIAGKHTLKGKDHHGELLIDAAPMSTTRRRAGAGHSISL